MRRDVDSAGERRPIAETLESRTHATVSPNLMGQTTFATRTELTVEAGALGQPIRFDVKVFAGTEVVGPVGLRYRGKMFQDLSGEVAEVVSTNPLLFESEATYTTAAGPAGEEMFGLGPHLVRAQFGGTPGRYNPSSAVARFRVTRPQFVTEPSGIGTATLIAGSGPTLQSGQTATVQYNAYLAASYRLFSSTTSQTPDTQTFVVDASPEQVIPGLDAGVVGMQPGETRAIYIPRSLSRGIRGSLPARQPRANLVILVTLVSID